MIKESQSYKQRNAYQVIKKRFDDRQENLIDKIIESTTKMRESQISNDSHIRSSSMRQRSQDYSLEDTPSRRVITESNSYKMPELQLKPSKINKNNIKDKIFFNQQYVKKKDLAKTIKQQSCITSSPKNQPLDLVKTQSILNQYYIDHNKESSFYNSKSSFNHATSRFMSQSFNFRSRNNSQKSLIPISTSIYSDQSSQIVEQTINLLNSADQRILNFSKAHEYEEANIRFKEDSSRFFSSPTLRENTKEQITLIENKFEYFKIDCNQKVFPLTLQAIKLNMPFKIYWSMSNPTPGSDSVFRGGCACINITKEQSWKIDISQQQKDKLNDKPFIYLGIFSQNYNFVEIRFWFTDINLQKYRKQQLPIDQIKLNSQIIQARLERKKKEKNYYDSNFELADEVCNKIVLRIRT